ncbi:ribonuclease R [bacterium SCSIO 12643]|nr:ribonuclease R [bacterium SCSIO 12643]
MGRKKKGKIHSKKGKNLKKIKNQILDVFIENPNKILNHKQISARLGFTSSSDRNIVIKALGGLKAARKLQETSPGKFAMISVPKFIEGNIELKRNGVAYVISDQMEDDVFIAPKFVHHALDGDRVKVALLSKRRGKSHSGQVVEIIERAQTNFVGVIEISKNFAFLIPDKVNMPVDIFIPLSKLKGAKNGEKVIAAITEWPKDASSPFGEIIDVLGKVGEADTEAYSILAQYDLPHRFPDHVEQEASKIALTINDAELKKRKDYRKVTTFTIDPVDAKDFDDALSFKKLDNGNYEVGVHIADVTHYVKEGDIIDQEAIQRATSVYLVDRVVPMLPEVLSNGVCSLRPNEDKLTFAAIFEITPDAKIIKTWLGRTIIHSDRRFTYEAVQEILESGDGEFVEELTILNDLAKTTRKARLDHGSIAFDKVEVRFRLDENKNPAGVFFKVQKDAHKLIEEFMLLANKAVAERIAIPKKGESAKTFVYRIHDKPNPEKLVAFSEFIRTFGYKFNANTENIAHSMNKLLMEIQGEREENMIEQLAIRTMAKAVYSTQNIGHYGLGFKNYTHFTSPIRRYPDMMVHRLLQRYLDHKPSADENTYENWCKHSSNQERKAAEAERESIKYFQVLFMENEVGKSFRGVISGVTEWGIYVEIIENKCEGMVRLREISGDYFTFDDTQHRIVGHNTGKIYQLGDEVDITVKEADLANRRLDFVLN